MAETTYNGFVKAARLISRAQGLLITAGAGMGVDSGLPDFRGKEGFWRAYPALRQPGIDFMSMASERTLWSRPRLAWGMYGHMLNLYRNATPHAGFQILRRIAGQLAGGAFVYTSNVDGQFQKAGFPEQQVHECHGSIHYLQCMDVCRQEIWSADGFEPVVDEEHCVLVNAPPACPHCGLMARPNVLMFYDSLWVASRSSRQHDKLNEWLQRFPHIVVVEIGAGTTISTVRDFGSRLKCPLIRINSYEARLRPNPQRVAFRMDALQALRAIEQALSTDGFFGTIM